MGYGSSQKVAFAGLLIGFLMCAAGCIAPFWLQGSLNGNKVASFVGKVLPIGGDIDLVTMNGGLWWWCREVLGNKECNAYDLQNNNKVEDWVIRIASVVNVVLTFVCALAALSRTCCCTGGKTICHGIMAFIAGGAGVVAIGLFAATASDGFIMKVKLVEFGWAFYIYIAGTATVTVVSFMLCFASPDNPLTPMIISSVGGAFTNGRYARIVEDRVPLEQASGDMNYQYPNVRSY